jgi:hypothetical protein
MWLPEQVPGLASELAALGFGLDPAALADPNAPPLSAIAGLGFCSASFVSPDGLLLSNLHCIEGFVALASTGERNHLEEGFTAASCADELPAGPAARIYVLESVDDVTSAVRAAVHAPGVTDADRIAVLDRVRTEIVAKCERARGRRCRVAAFDGGSSYRLLRSLEIRDVRIVHSPADGLGYFGGDLDNYEWPRHDADYGILRAYVGPDGKPAAPSPRNVPYHPAAHLRIDPTGVGPGEAVMAIGYPGGTSRTALPEELAWQVEVGNPHSLDRYALLERIVAEERATSEEADRHLQAQANDLANYRKYDQGIQDNVLRGTALADSRARGAAIDAATAGDPAAREAITELRRVVAEGQAAAVRRQSLDDLFSLSYLSVAHTAYRWSVERGRKDADREPGLQDRDREDLEAWFTELDDQIWLPAEGRVSSELITRYVASPPASQVEALDAWLAAQGGPERAIAALQAPSQALGTPEARRATLSQKRTALEASTDPWMSLAVALERGFLEADRAGSEAREGALLRLRPAWITALRAVQGGRSYPDANGTLRYTFGKVEGYRVRDGLVATPITGLSGIVEKERLPAYEAPPEFLSAIAASGSSPFVDAALGEVPVNFLSSVDTTGGNSGSATLDAQGRLVGLVFDGNYESMAADWQFDTATTRSVHVDIRYVGWLLSLQPNGKWILDELGF